MLWSSKAHRLRNCGAWAWFLRGMWHAVPRPGIKPISLSLAGGFLTTGPPGKSHLNLMYFWANRKKEGKQKGL